MKRAIALLMLLVLIATGFYFLQVVRKPVEFVAPSPRTVPSFQNSPEGVVRKILDAVEKQDADQYLDALDPDLRDQPNYFFVNALVKGLLSYLGLSGMGDLSQVAFRDLSFQTLSDDGKVGEVYVQGKMRNLALATEGDFSGTFFTRNINGRWYVSSQSQAAAPTSDPNLKLIPWRVELSEPSGGWRSLSVYLTLENGSSEWYTYRIQKELLLTESGLICEPCPYVATAEGFTYGPFLGGDIEITLPPQMRLREGDFLFKVAQNTHGYKLIVPSYYAQPLGGEEIKISTPITIDLDKDLQSAESLSFPFSSTPAYVKQLGEPIDLPEWGAITIDGVIPPPFSKYSPYSSYEVFSGRLRNDHQGYGLKVFIRSEIVAVNLSPDEYSYGDYMEWLREVSVEAGPGVTKTFKISMLDGTLEPHYEFWLLVLVYHDTSNAPPISTAVIQVGQ